MISMHKNGYLKTKGLMLLAVISMMMGCASGTPKIEAFKVNEETVQAVKAKCTGVFDDASGGTLSALWANKRRILEQSRECSESANLLAGQVENRNKVITEK